jgi:hypothetical protein
MPRLAPRQEPPAQGRILGPAPTCIACGNTRTFWVRRGEEVVHVAAWTLEPADKLVACGRCRSRNSLVLGWAED